MLFGSQDMKDPLNTWLRDLRDQYQAGAFDIPANHTRVMESPFGVHSIEECRDEDGEDYLLVSFILEDDIFAQVDGGTYGTLEAIRIYKEPQ